MAAISALIIDHNVEDIRMANAPVQCSIEDGVALVTLSNPPLNLVTLALTRHLNDLVTKLAADPSVRVMVVTGSGSKAFCAGNPAHWRDSLRGLILAHFWCRAMRPYQSLSGAEGTSGT